jgi:hypothetical protein
MSSDNDSKKVQSETIFTIIAGIVGLVALIGLIYVLCLLRRRHQQHQLRRQQQQQQPGTTTRTSSRAKPRMSRKQQQSASSLRRHVLSTPSQPEDTYSIDSSSTMIELQQRFHGSGLRSVESNSSFMADMFSITSDMLMQQSSPTSATLSPQQPVSVFNSVDHTNHQSSPKRPPPYPSFGNTNHTNNSSESIFVTNFATLPISKSSAIILNKQNDNSTAGDDNDDDFDEVWSYVAVRTLSLYMYILGIRPVDYTYTSQKVSKST